MSAMSDAQVRAILRDKKAGKLKQGPGVEMKATKEFTKSPNSGLIGRKRAYEELKQTALNFNKKSNVKQDSRKKKEIATGSNDDVVEISEMKDQPRWYVHMKSMEFEVREAEAIRDRLEMELEELKGKNKELETKVKKCAGHDGEIAKLKKLNNNLEEKLAKVAKEKNDAVANEEIQIGIASSLQTDVEQKEKEIMDLQTEVADRYDSGFEFAISQVKVLHPEVDLSEISILKVIVDGKLVELTEENAGKSGEQVKEGEPTTVEKNANEEKQGSLDEENPKE